MNRSCFKIRPAAMAFVIARNITAKDVIHTVDAHQHYPISQFRAFTGLWGDAMMAGLSIQDVYDAAYDLEIQNLMKDIL